MGNIAIDVHDVSKRFRKSSEFNTFKERAINSFRRSHRPSFWALQGINLEIKEGQTFGLLGANGSGKSTLLKVIAGILTPNSGYIHARGRMAALLELGAGFHPDLTGRENVFLNASILGLPKKEIEKRFDDIVEFAELENFIDDQVKHYSSGMYVRLGFAVAVTMEPDILLVDEVLAVGDEAFQRKCLERVKRLQKDGHTIVFVTHSPDLVRMICDGATVLDHGHQLLVTDKPGEAVRKYREIVFGTAPDEEAAENAQEAVATGDSDAEPTGQPVERTPSAKPGKKRKPLKITAIDVAHVHSDERPYVLPGESISIQIAFDAFEPIDDVVFGIAFYDQEGKNIFGTNTEILEMPNRVDKGPGGITFRIASVPLLDGTYHITVGSHNSGGANVYDWRDQEAEFQVMNPSRNAGLVDLAVTASFDEIPARELPPTIDDADARTLEGAG